MIKSNTFENTKANNHKKKNHIMKSYTEESLLHSVTLNAEEKAILPRINFAGPLGNIAQLSACCRYKNPAPTRCTNRTILIHQGCTKNLKPLKPRTSNLPVKPAYRPKPKAF